MKNIVFVLGLVLLIAGCGNKSLPPIPPPPSADEGMAMVPSWSALTNAAAVKSVFKLGETSSTPTLIAPGAVELPVDFSGAKPPMRASWDIRLDCDLSKCDGLQFDFYCDDLAQFSGLSFYCKSGDGWFHGSFEAEDDGVWQRVRLLKSQARSEGKVGQWDQVKTLRISGWRSGKGKFRCAMANLAYLGGGKPDVVVVYAASLLAQGGSEAKGYLHFADNFSGTLSALGLTARIVGDNELTADLLKDTKAVVLPYNPGFPVDKLVLLQDYVAAGGRFLACYVLPTSITDLLGVKLLGGRRSGAGGGAAIAGMVKAGKALPGMPDFSPQASWMTEVVSRAPGVEVVAEWASGDRKSLGIPALARTSRGLFMGHVWLGGTESANLQFMRAVMTDLSPELGEKMTKSIDERKKREAELKAWMEKRPSRRDDVRALWCHSARGLAGRDWDASIKFLKDNGFNTIIPNLCWGGTAFYPSKVLPVAADVATKGNAFEQCRAACRKYGVKMHVWKVCWNMGNVVDPAHAKKMQEAGRTQVDYSGKAHEKWLCPSHPENRKLEIEAMVELAKMGPDGIHFDYIRYPGAEYCFCEGCRSRFEAMLGAKVENWPADVRDEKKLKGRWNEFRASNITAVVKTVAERVRKEAPGVKISAALFRNPDSDPRTVAQDWPAWCRDGLLDFACNMDYVASTPSFRGQVRAQLQAAGKVPVYPGIGLSCWPNDGRDGERLAKQIQAARDLGTKGFTVFALDRRAEAVLPLLRLGVTKEDPR